MMTKDERINQFIDFAEEIPDEIVEDLVIRDNTAKVRLKGGNEAKVRKWAKKAGEILTNVNVEKMKETDDLTITDELGAGLVKTFEAKFVGYIYEEGGK